MFDETVRSCVEVHEQGATERLDLGLCGVPLEKEGDDRAKQVNAYRCESDRDEIASQATMRGSRRAHNVAELA